MDWSTSRKTQEGKTELVASVVSVPHVWLVSEADKIGPTDSSTTVRTISEHQTTQTWYYSLRFLACRRLSSGRCTTLVVSALTASADLGFVAFTCVLIQFHAVQDMGEDFVEDSDEGSGWSSDQVSRFFDAFQQHGQDWVQVCIQ